VSGLIRSSGRYVGLGGAARVFGLVALTVPVIWAFDPYALVGLLGLSVIWMVATTVAGLTRAPRWATLLVEAGLIGGLVGAAIPHTLLLAPALAVTPFVSGAVRGIRGVVEAIVIQLGAISLMAFQLGWQADRTMGITVFSWLAVGIGSGLVAAYARSLQVGVMDHLTPYRDARALISKLLDLSGDLSEGLDPVSISQHVVAQAREELPFVGAVVYVRRGETPTPLVESAEHAGLDTGSREKLVNRVWSTAAPATARGEIAFPLCTDAGVVVAVVAAGLAHDLADRLPVEGTLQSLTARFRVEALQLDTALLFAAVRAEATADERRRLAREVHDGVAQDLVSLGYLVDDLQDSATSAIQAELFGLLRLDISRIVAELRRSIFSLRNEAAATGSLGESVSALARHVTTVSGIPVHLRLDEGSARLRGEVEAELLRITQQAMNNAVKHGEPENIWVHCTVAAPSAEVVVRDDGSGLGKVRHDSHGIRIMHERAKLIGATVTLENAEERGAVMRVVVSGAPTTAEELRGLAST
jgi:signal transduction histidine kinase